MRIVVWAGRSDFRVENDMLKAVRRSDGIEHGGHVLGARVQRSSMRVLPALLDGRHFGLHGVEGARELLAGLIGPRLPLQREKALHRLHG